MASAHSDIFVGNVATGTTEAALLGALRAVCPVAPKGVLLRRGNLKTLRKLQDLQR